MNDNFQQSPCQAFTMSGCQNRNNGPSVPPATFAFIAVNQGTTNGWGLQTPGKSFGAYTQLFVGFGILEGVLNSVQLDGHGNPISWDINWNVEGNINQGIKNGIYSSVLFLSVQGPPKSMYGTMAFHPVVNPNSNPPVYGPATQTLMRDWSERFDSPSAEFPITVPKTGAMAFWIGKKPTDLPAGNFTFESFGFGRI